VKEETSEDYTFTMSLRVDKKRLVGMKEADANSIIKK